MLKRRIIIVSIWSYMYFYIFILWLNMVYLVHLIHKMSCDSRRKKQTPNTTSSVWGKSTHGASPSHPHNTADAICLFSWSHRSSGSCSCRTPWSASTFTTEIATPKYKHLWTMRQTKIWKSHWNNVAVTILPCDFVSVFIFTQGTCNLHPAALGQGSRSVDPLQTLQFQQSATRCHPCAPRLCDLPRRRKSTLPAARNRPSSRTGGVGHTWT